MGDKNINKGEIQADGNVHIGYIYNGQKLEISKYLTGPIPKVAEEDIIGRETELEALEKLLSESEKVVLVNGLGGIGKTTVARRYLTLHQEKVDYIAVVEVLLDEKNDSNNFQTTLANHENLFQNLNLSFDLEQPEEKRFERVVSALQNLKGNNLLLIDNAGKPLESLVHQLPGKPFWKVLVTSREKLEGFEKYELDTLSLEKARELFVKHAGNVDQTELDELLEFIGCHTLTTELLAKTFKKSLTLNTPAELLTLLKKRQLDAEKLAKKIVVDHSKNEAITMYTHLLTAFTLAGLEELEIWLLKQFAMMPAQAMAGAFILKVLESTEDNEEKIADALQSLLQKGWINEIGEQQFQVHRMVQEVISYQEEITFEDCKNLIGGVTDLLSIDQAKDNPVDKFQWVIFGDRLLLHFSKEKQPGIATLENNLAMVYQDLGSYEKAAELLEKALSSDQQNFRENHPTVAGSMSNLAGVYKDLGSYEKAAELLEKALSSDQQNFGENHPSVARSLHNLGAVYFKIKRFKEAQSNISKAYQIFVHQLGADHPNSKTVKSWLDQVERELAK